MLLENENKNKYFDDYPAIRAANGFSFVSIL